MVGIKEKITETRDQFRHLVWPIWRSSFGATELISVEGSERAFEQRADASGIDAFFARRSDGVLIPLASRIEYATSKNVEISRRLNRRFTIRSQKSDQQGWHSNTELRRLMIASADPIARRYLPYRTIHTLLSRDKDCVLFTSAVCTQKLCDFARSMIEQGRASEKMTRQRDAKFMEFFVDEMREAKIEVDSYP